MVPDGKDVCSTFESKEWRGEQRGAGGGFCKGAREITPKLAGVQRGVATRHGSVEDEARRAGPSCCPEDLESFWFCNVGDPA